MADAAYQLADCHEQQRDVEQAAGAYSPKRGEKAIPALARLQLSRGELEAAQELCMALMRIDGTNREASMILADLMLQKSEWEAAIFHFQQLLERAPANFEAIVKLLQPLRRAGRLGRRRASWRRRSTRRRAPRSSRASASARGCCTGTQTTRAPRSRRSTSRAARASGPSAR